MLRLDGSPVVYELRNNSRRTVVPYYNEPLPKLEYFDGTQWRAIRDRGCVEIALPAHGRSSVVNSLPPIECIFITRGFLPGVRGRSSVVHNLQDYFPPLISGRQHRITITLGIERIRGIQGGGFRGFFTRELVHEFYWE